MMKKFFISALFLLPFFFGCADKFDINSQLGDTNNGTGNITGDTVYIQIDPNHPWGGFNNPQAILVGREPFIYVCDTDNDRIVMLNTAGTVLGSIHIQKPTSIAQDYRLNLIVCAQFDTLGKSFSAVYKIDLVAVNHIIADAPIKRLLPMEADLIHPDRKYTAVAAFYDNSFYVARFGPSNSSIYDPDNSILQFVEKPDHTDSLVTRLHDIDPLSAGLITANGINSMTSFNKKNLDFIATFSKGLENETMFKTQWFQHYQTMSSEGYRSPYNPNDGMKIVVPGRFAAPTGCCLDPSGNIYVADGDVTRDSVFKFNSYGDELESFGGPSVFSKPTGVAYFDRTLYVLDAGKNQILRFILSTDIR